MEYYLPFDSDRAHLQVAQQQHHHILHLDYYDIALILINITIIISILIYYFCTTSLIQYLPKGPTRKSWSI